MLTKRQLAAIERLIAVGEEEEVYRMNESSDRRNYTETDRRNLERDIALSNKALAILRQMAGNRVFVVSWRQENRDEDLFFYSATKMADDRFVEAAMKRIVGPDDDDCDEPRDNYILCHEEVPFTAVPITEIGR